MIEVKILGRGGQGVVSASAVLASALFKENYFAQAFPMYGVERSGGPARAFLRIDKEPIHRYDQIYSPYVLLVIDPTTLKEEIETLKTAGLMIINTPKSVEEIKKEFPLKQTCVVKTIDATKIALDTVGKPFSNVPMIGAFVGMTNLISLKAVNDAIAEIWGDKGEAVVKGNQEMAKKGYEKLYCKTCVVKI
jgi:pyruvate ferredoxin oxidoreductase gamma subunit